MKILKILLGRVSLILLATALQAVFSIAVLRWFAQQAAWIETVIRVLSVVILLYIIKNSKHLSSDIIWIVLIAIIPVSGTLLYLFLGADLLTSRTNRQIREATEMTLPHFQQDPSVAKSFAREYPEYRGQFQYISSTGGYPIYRNEGFEYYPLGEKGFPVMLKELKKAQDFIFMEYFIIEEGYMWSTILDILKEKAAQGVEVKIIYDDFGTFFSLSKDDVRKLEAAGIRCLPFNQINPVLNIIINHRDHRKIMVIDGKTAFSGGINLADEYINRKMRFGIWKDNLIKITGQAVWSYTLMFLSHWNALIEEDEPFERYKADLPASETDGYIAPYGDTPLDDELLSQNIYMNILNQSNRYCYIFTPYLIVDTDMINTLISCAKRGVDVRIVVPGIPDKKIVNYITKSYYRVLIQGGVKIYEYTPGFVHSKVFVADDRIATVGTVNLDYRSLYLHFENGTYLCGSKKIRKIKKDLVDTMDQCRQIELDDAFYGIVGETVQLVLRLFAPLM